MREWNAANPPAMGAIPALSAGQSVNVTVDVPLRSPDDVYRAQGGEVDVWIDPSLGDSCCGDIAETDDFNNQRVIPVALKSGPTYAAGLVPDLGVTRVSATTIRTNGTDERTIDVSVDLANTGPTGARGDKQLLAQIGTSPTYDPGIDSSAAFLADVDGDGQATAATTVTWSGDIPATPRYAIVCANLAAAVVPDSNLTNNCASTQLKFDDTKVPPTRAPGEWPAFPNPAQQLTVTPTVSAPSVTRAYTWDDSIWRTDQLTAGPGVAAAFTFTPGQTFTDLFDFTAATTSFGADFPFTTNLGAIDIEPGDVWADRAFPVTFTLSGEAAEVPVGELVAYAADTDGSNFRLVPIEPTSTATALTVKLDHVGIVGVARATAAQIVAVRDHWAVQPDQQLEQVAAIPSA